MPPEVDIHQIESHEANVPAGGYRLLLEWVTHSYDSVDQMSIMEMGIKMTGQKNVSRHLPFVSPAIACNLRYDIERSVSPFPSARLSR